MKAMFVGGRFHAQLLELPKGDTVYDTVVKINGNVVELTYTAVRHPQLFELTAYNGKPCVVLPLDYYMNERIKYWIENISRWSSTALNAGATKKPQEN